MMLSNSAILMILKDLKHFPVFIKQKNEIAK